MFLKLASIALVLTVLACVFVAVLSKRGWNRVRARMAQKAMKPCCVHVTDALWFESDAPEPRSLNLDCSPTESQRNDIERGYVSEDTVSIGDVRKRMRMTRSSSGSPRLIIIVGG